MSTTTDQARWFSEGRAPGLGASRALADRATLLMAALLFLAVYLTPHLLQDASAAAVALYAAPIALVAGRFGLRAGLAAVAVAVGLTLLWAVDRGAAVNPVALAARLVGYLVTGAAVGLISDHVQRVIADRTTIELARDEAERQRRRLDVLQSVTRRLSRAATVEEVGRAFLEAGLPPVGAAEGGVFTVIESDDGVQRLLSAAMHYESRTVVDWSAPVDMSLATPPTEAFRAGRAAYLPDRDALERAFPHLVPPAGHSTLQAWASLPLRVGDHLLGVMTVAFTSPQVFGTDQRALVEGLADRVAEAIDRAQVLADMRYHRLRAERQEARASLLADVGAVLTDGADSAVRMQRLVDLLVPRFVDAASIEVSERTEYRMLARAGVGPDADTRLDAALVAAENRRTGTGSGPDPVRPSASPLPPGVHVLPGDDPSAHYTSAVLEARGQRLGRLVLSWSGAREEFGEPDVALARLIAGRTALALDNARLQSDQLRAVTVLQRALLPERLPWSPAVTATARYHSGTATLDVGGDWYDLIDLPDSAMGIVLGDVVGRGVAAAATMGQLRTAVHALAPYATSPAEVLRRLDDVTAPVPGAELATVAYARFEPAAGLLRYSCAGHPPPVLLEPGRPARLLEGGRSVPLGTGSGLPWREATLHLDGPAVLVLYSDGLIDQRGVPVDDRLAELVRHVDRFAGEPLLRLRDGIVDAMVGQEVLHDDVALLCVALQPARARSFHRVLPADARLLAGLRRALRTWLADQGITAADQSDVLIAVGEACANAVEHAYADEERDAEVEVLVTCEDDVVTARVTDSGAWRTQLEDRSHRGRGLAMMHRAMSGVAIDRGDAGTDVVLRRPVA